MDRVTKCRNEMRRLLHAVAFSKPNDRQVLLRASYGKLAEFERLLTTKSNKLELEQMLKDTS